nr:MAG TPA: hypothetical protein [Caudoviricetes sp.]DAI53748.1 MAG TPA: hypothetical protein [Caudoviricetes sp.]
MLEVEITQTFLVFSHFNLMDFVYIYYLVKTKKEATVRDG